MESRHQGLVAVASLAVAVVTLIVGDNLINRGQPSTPTSFPFVEGTVGGTQSSEAQTPSQDAGYAPDVVSTDELLPDALLGHWSGTVLQSNTSSTYLAEFSLAQIVDGGSDIGGSSNYPTLGCSGVLRFAKSVGQYFEFDETITEGQSNCISGITKRFRVNADGTLDYSWVLGDDPRNGQATLVKTP